MKRKIVRIQFAPEGRTYAYRCNRRCKKDDIVGVWDRYGRWRELPVVGLGRRLWFGPLVTAQFVSQRGEAIASETAELDAYSVFGGNV